MRDESAVESVKALIKSTDNRYLILTFNQHPYFSSDIDLPGGELDAGEDVIQAIVREIYEEVGLRIKSGNCHMCASTREYSRSGNLYTLIEIELKEPVSVKLSCEHIKYEWLEVGEVIRRGYQSKNKYLHLAADILTGKL